MLKIISGGISDYTVIVPENAESGDLQTASELLDFIYEATGVRIGLKDDWLDIRNGETPSAHEIIVGSTNRPESAQAVSMCGAYEDFAGFIGEKLVLCGKSGSLSAVLEALKKIISENAGNGELSLSSALSIKEGSAEYTLATLNGEYFLGFIKMNGQYILSVAGNDGAERALSKTPAAINVVNASGIEVSYSVGYDRIAKNGDSLECSADIACRDGSVFGITDIWKAGEYSFSFERTASVKTVGGGYTGYASAFGFSFAGAGTNRDSFEYFIPAVLYCDTENMTAASVMSDLSGERSYVKETRTGTPLVMLRRKSTGDYIALQHIEPELSETDNLYQKAFTVNGGSRYGSLGYVFDASDNSAGVGFIYPSSEGPLSYETGRTWARRYHPVSGGFSHSYSMALIPGGGEKYTDSMTDCYRKAFLLADPEVGEANLDLLYTQTMEVYDGLYTEYNGPDGSMAAGTPFIVGVLNKAVRHEKYFVNGFTGAQSDVGYELYREGILTKNSEYIRKGKNILDFWCSEGVWPASSALPPVWWMPSNGNKAGGDTGYPVMIRHLTDGAEGILDAYIFALKNGTDMTEWKKTVLRTADFLAGNQNSDGSFYRAYNRDGTVCNVTSDANYNGTSKLNTPVAVRFLGRVYELTGEKKYLDAALKAADYSYETLYKTMGKYVGGTPDNPNVTDKEAAIYAMYCFEAAYMLSGDGKYYDAYLHALYSTMSWFITYDYKVPYPINNAVKNINIFKEGGVNGFSFIAIGHSGIDVFGATLYCDLFRQYVRTGESIYLTFAGISQNNARRTSDMYGKYGYMYRGIASEACIAADFVYYASLDGIYVPWISVAFCADMITMRNLFGDADIYNAVNKYSLTELQAIFDNYGLGGSATSN